MVLSFFSGFSDPSDPATEDKKTFRQEIFLHQGNFMVDRTGWVGQNFH